MEAASEQPASKSGSSTVFCGLMILAVSAMKRTPQSTMTSAATRAPSWASPRESPR
jgi:hypothetical protein